MFAPACRRRAADGLTLLELLVALVILSLLVALIPPALNGINLQWQLRSAAHEIENFTHRAQNMAVAKGVPIRLSYDVPNNAYWIGFGDETQSYRHLPDSVTFDAVRFGPGVVITNDVAVCQAFPDGTMDAHEVTLKGADELAARLTFERLDTEPWYEEGTAHDLLR